MAICKSLETRLLALEEARQSTLVSDPQLEKDIRTASAYFHTKVPNCGTLNDRTEVLPPDYFSEGERAALQIIIKLHREV